jgi:hypothetical protein
VGVNSPSSLAARWVLPDRIVRGRDTDVTLEVYQSGARQTLASVSVVVSRADGTEFASGSAVLSDSDRTATYTVTGTSAESLSDGWRVVWTATVGGVVYTFGNEAMLVRQPLAPVLADADLFTRVSSLDPSGTTPITSLADYQAYRDEAWIEIQQRLIQEGNRPALVLSPTALRGAHLELTLALIFEDLSTRLNEAYEARAQQYRRQYHDAWRRLTFRYDADEDGAIDDTRRRRGHGTLWMCGGRARSVR